ncbi:recombinase family protein [Clostridium sp. E02]|uniref:recombinase family protein n=1 Tax=Clostridium sp. E02 TaxID=2487134 RepID=UPI000F532067|nr:recombinase family protein [Clostridium sp. E02]
MSDYLMYLRKSRADRDFVEEDVMKTLTRHKERLDAFCRDQHIAVSKVFYEIVSADSIAARPEMLKLLQLVEAGKYEGVIVIEMDRLCRGDSIDQGIVINTFKYSATKIITPYKTYDFANEFDEEYAEYGLMMGRSEYRKIKRRLWNGRLDSVHEGKYVGGNPPYGYETYKLPKQKGFSLKIIPDQADVVRLIFDMYVNGFLENGVFRESGSYVIAKKLNEMGYVDQFNLPWNQSHVTKILTDETYTGKVVFMRRREQKEVRNGELITIQVNNSPDKLVVNGLHEAIISEELFQMAKEKRALNRIPHLRRAAEMQNPLCHIVKCGLCGKNLRLRSADSTGQRGLFCANVNCLCKGSYLGLVEDRLISVLNHWTKDYLIENKNTEADDIIPIKSLEKTITVLKKEMEVAQKQLANIYDLFEKGIYNLEIFSERSSILNSTISSLKERYEASQKEYKKFQEYKIAKRTLVPKIQTVIEKYNSIETAGEKNILLKEILEKIVYVKEKGGKTHADNFTLQVFPKIPKL